MKYLILLCLFIVLLAQSCKKKQEAIPTPPANTNTQPPDPTIPIVVTDTFRGGYHIYFPDYDETNKIDTPVIFYVSRSKTRLYIQSFTVIASTAMDEPIIIDYTLAVIKDNIYTLIPGKEILRFSSDSIYFEWDHKKEFKSPNGQGYRSYGYLYGKKKHH